ncbi:MAG: ERF family protein [Solirubrobacteraceae bacterium]
MATRGTRTAPAVEVGEAPPLAEEFDYDVTVDEAIRRVMRDLPSIAKSERAPDAMGGFAFRGVEQIAEAAKPLLAKHGLIIKGRTSLLQVVHSPGSKENWQDTYIEVRWKLTGPDGSEDEATTLGVGRDNADKGVPKAQTQAYKQLLIQLFCINDAKNDADGHDYSASQLSAEELQAERDAQLREQQATDLGWASAADYLAFRDRVKRIGTTDETFAAWWKAEGIKYPITKTDAGPVIARMDEAERTIAEGDSPVHSLPGEGAPASDGPVPPVDVEGEPPPPHPDDDPTRPFTDD